MYHTIKDETEQRIKQGENIDPEDWMEGQWYPSTQSIDPECKRDEISRSVFFPLEGNDCIQTPINHNKYQKCKRYH